MPRLPWARAKTGSGPSKGAERGPRWISFWSIAAGAMLLLVFGARLLPLLAGASQGAFPSIEGIECERGERLNYHIHAHLALFVEGREVAVPAGIGITDRCLYWLHTHAADGIIHIEAPSRREFTLGQFFAVWGQPLGRTRFLDQTVDSSHELRAYVNGQPFDGDPASIKLEDGTAIVIEYGPPFVPISLHG
jgi:hypothetical protein